MSEEIFEFDVLTLLDENEEEHEFELVDSMEIDGTEYIALIPVFDETEDIPEDSGELIIMRAAYEDGEQFLDTIDDDLEYAEISEVFMERLSEDFEFHEEDTDDLD